MIMMKNSKKQKNKSEKIFDKKHVQVVSAIIIEKDMVFCFKKGKAKYKYLENKFEFPGGKIKKNENKIDALKREILEELNVEIEVLEPLCESDYNYPDFTVSLSSFICRAQRSSFILTEHVEVVKVPISDIDKLQWLPADIPIVNALKALNNDKI
tara:strand:- start:185 stop:649 length:465 start_codon:yes stop_codon:yes gene_type:complete